MTAQLHMDVQKRFLAIIKPEQSGKTFVMIEMINNALETVDSSGNTVVNFIFCDNNLLQTLQTTERMKRDVNKLPGTTQHYVMFSSSSVHDNVKTPEGVFHKIVAEGVTNIICCTNHTRVEDCLRLITCFNKSKLLVRLGLVFKLWIDEADKFVNFISNTFLPVL